MKTNEKIDYYAEYSKLLDPFLSDGENQYKAVCPFHPDSNPSLSVNTETGQFKCFGCPAKGNYPTFLKKLSLLEAVNSPSNGGKENSSNGKNSKLIKSSENEVKDISKLLDQGLEAAFQNNLINKADKEIYERLLKMGFTDETISKRKLGYDLNEKRYTIPIYDKDGGLRNIRKYNPDDNTGNKVTSVQGYGKACLYPIENLKLDQLIIVEGEKDAIIGNQEGFPCITGTCGALTWPKAYNESFRDKDVIIFYDDDETGIKGSDNAASKLYGIAKSVKIATLPELKGNGDDLTDFFVKYGKTRKEFNKILGNAIEYIPTDQSDSNETIDYSKAFLNGKQLQDLEITEIPTIFLWLPEGGSALIFGRRGIGKTFIVLHLALAFVMGLPFIKWDKPKNKYPTLYVDGEMGLKDIRKRLLYFFPEIPEQLHILCKENFYQFNKDLNLAKEEFQSIISNYLICHPEIK